MDSPLKSKNLNLASLSAENQIELWRKASSGVAMGLLIFSADGHTFSADESVIALFGVKKSAVFSVEDFRNWLDCESESFFNTLQQSLKTNSPLDEVIVPKNRTSAWIRIIGAPRGEESVRGFLVWDRTEKSQKEMQLEGDRHFFETVLNSFSDPVTITDSNLKFIYGNTAFSSVVGLIPEEYYGRTMADIGLVNAEDFHRGDRRCLSEHVEVESEEALQFGSVGTDVAAQLWLVKRVPYSAPSGNTTIVSVFRDIREVRRMQLELDRSRARSSQIARLRGLATLAAGVAHELNNPLMIASGAIEAISDHFGETPERSAIDTHLARATRGIRRATEIVKAMQKMGANTTASDRENTGVDLTSVIESVGLILSTELTLHKVDFSINGSQSAVVHASESGLIRAIMALVQNAIESIASGDRSARSVSIAFDRRPNESLWTVTIEDSGSGILLGDQDRIFEPFYSTKEIGQGLGLGLTLAKEAIEAMGGRLEYSGSSSLGGASFQIVLNEFRGGSST